MFNKLDRYILKKFMATYFYAIGLIVILVVVFDLSEKLDDFIENKAPLNAIIFDYYVNFIPYFVNLFSGLFTFIAVIFFTSKMATHSEIIAILSGGVSYRRFLRPYFVGGIILTLLSFTLINWVIPHANIKEWTSMRSIAEAVHIRIETTTYIVRFHPGYLFICSRTIQRWILDTDFR